MRCPTFDRYLIAINATEVAICIDWSLTLSIRYRILHICVNKDLIIFFFQAIALFALVAVAVAAPKSSNDADAQVLKSELDNIGVEGFHYG